MEHKTTEPQEQLYVAFIRGVNVGGKSSVPMAKLREILRHDGFTDVTTLLNSGNVVLRSPESAQVISQRIENLLRQQFLLGEHSGGVHVLSALQLRLAITNAPQGFGSEPQMFHSDVIFLMGIDATRAREAFSPREGIDTIWQGDGVIYSQRLSAQRTQSRLNRVMQHPLYKSMTIRTWNTVLKINAAAEALALN